LLAAKKDAIVPLRSRDLILEMHRVRGSRNFGRCETGLEDHQGLHEYTRIPTFCHVASVVGKSSCGSGLPFPLCRKGRGL
jgi:hypothetical protein